MKLKIYAIINCIIAFGLIILALKTEDQNKSDFIKFIAIIVLLITRNFIIKPNQET